MRLHSGFTLASPFELEVVETPAAFQGAEGMLAQRFALLHFLRLQGDARGHFIHEVLVRFTREAAVAFVARALRFEGTLRTRFGAVVAQLAPFSFVLKR